MNEHVFSSALLVNPTLLAGYRQLLRFEGWDPTASGADPSECDTIPLFSRYDHLHFLDDQGILDKEAAVLAMAFWYWLEVETTLAERRYSLRYVNDFSFMDWELAEGTLPYPDLFFCADVGLLRSGRKWEPCSKRSERLLAVLGRLGLAQHAIVHEQPVDRDSDCTVIDFKLGSNPQKVFRWESLRE